MNIKKRYKQLNELITFINKNEFDTNDPVFINACESISLISNQINKTIHREFYQAKKKSSKVSNLFLISVSSKLNYS